MPGRCTASRSSLGSEPESEPSCGPSVPCLSPPNVGPLSAHLVSPRCWVILALNPPSSPAPADISTASSPASKLQKISIPRTVILTESLLLPAFAITYPFVTSVTCGQNADKTRRSPKNSYIRSDARDARFCTLAETKFPCDRQEARFRPRCGRPDLSLNTCTLCLWTPLCFAWFWYAPAIR